MMMSRDYESVVAIGQTGLASGVSNAALRELRLLLEAPPGTRLWTRVVTITGAGGMGKSTVLTAWLAELAARPKEHRVYVGYGQAGHLRNDFAAIRTAVASLIESTGRHGRGSARRVGKIMRAVAPEWLNAVPIVGGALRAVMITADTVFEYHRSARPASLVDQLIGLLVSLAQERPVVLLLDDLHRADQETLDLIFDVGRAADSAGVPVLLVCAFRPAGPDEDLPVSRMVSDLARFISRRDVALPRLTVHEVTAMVRVSYGITPPQTLTGWLLRRSGGNPLFVRALLDVLPGRGLPSPDDWTDSLIDETLRKMDESPDKLPDIDAVLLERLRGLTPPERQILDLAAVLGTSIDPAELLALSDTPDTITREALHGLCVHHGLLISSGTGTDTRYAFAFDLLPDLILRQLQADRPGLIETHRRCAAHLEDSGDRRAFVTWERLAWHWYQAGRPANAVSAAHRGVWAAYRNASTRELALALADRVQRWCGDDDLDLAAQCEMVIAEAQQARHDPDAAFAALKRAEAKASDPSLAKAHALFFRGGIAAIGNPDRGRSDLAEAAVEMIRRIAGEAHDRPVRSLHHHLLLTALFAATSEAINASNFNRAEQLLLDIAAAGPGEWAADWGDFTYNIALHRGRMYFAQRNWRQAEKTYALAIKQCTNSNLEQDSVTIRRDRAIALCHLGEEHDGLAELVECLTLSRDTYRTPYGVADTFVSLGKFHRSKDRLYEAAELFLLALRIYDEMDSDDSRGVQDMLSGIASEVGVPEFGAYVERFRPERSVWAPYALLWGLGKLRKTGPVLTATGDGWQSRAVFNPAVDNRDGVVKLLYRAIGDVPTSVIGLAESVDGVTFVRRPAPVLTATEPWELPGGCEDPRLARTDAGFWLTYTAFDGRTARVAAAHSPDLVDWRKTGLIFDDNDWPRWFPQHQLPAVPPGWTKSAVLSPIETDGRRWLYFGDTHIWAAWTDDSDLKRWHVNQRPVLSPRPGRFDSRLVEPGPPPFQTPEGTVLLYNAADDDLAYAVGQILLSPDDPTRVLRRCGRPILSVTEPLEKVGVVPNVVFATGLVKHLGSWLLYYGMGDTAIGLATTDYP